MKTKIDKALVAGRANDAKNNTYGHFFKTYIKNAKIVRNKRVTKYKSEIDFEFDYKGVTYRLCEKIKGGEYSAVGEYFIEKIA